MKYGGFSTTSENFSTAGRSIKAGLTACDIVGECRASTPPQQQLDCLVAFI